MAIHTVKKGETLISIAHDAGFRDWHAIWDHRNNADLRAKRPDPQVLREGDALYVPERMPRRFVCQTEERHRFRLRPEPCLFCVYLRDEVGTPFAGLRYELTIEGRTMSGTTSPEGRVQHAIKPTDRSGTLKLWRNPDDPSDVYEWPLRVGALDPIETVAGVKARLNNLGYKLGTINDDLDDATREALKDFQRQIGHEAPTGAIDDATRTALAAQHDRR
jgi:hypothetical protein